MTDIIIREKGPLSFFLSIHEESKKFWDDHPQLRAKTFKNHPNKHLCSALDNNSIRSIRIRLEYLLIAEISVPD